jgi:hypothetical protein
MGSSSSSGRPIARPRSLGRTSPRSCEGRQRIQLLLWRRRHPSQLSNRHVRVIEHTRHPGYLLAYRLDARGMFAFSCISCLACIHHSSLGIPADITVEDLSIHVAKESKDSQGTGYSTHKASIQARPRSRPNKRFGLQTDHQRFNEEYFLSQRWGPMWGQVVVRVNGNDDGTTRHNDEFHSSSSVIIVIQSPLQII